MDAGTPTHGGRWGRAPKIPAPSTGSGISLKMYTQFRNFLSFQDIIEAMSAKNFATLAMWPT